MRDTLPALLERAAAHPLPDGGIRFIDRRERETWSAWPDIRARARAAAGYLKAAGVQRGQRVAIILPTGASFFDAYFGAQYIGAVPVPMYPPVRLGRLDEYFERTVAMFEASEAVALVTEPRIRRVLGRLLANVSLPSGVIDAPRLLSGQDTYEPPTPDELAMVQFSSGTTVAPKPVALSHEAVLANAARVLDVIYQSDPRHAGRPWEPSGVSWLPLYHDMGLIGAIFPALIANGCINLIPPEVFLAKPILWLRAISRHRGTISPAPNFAYSLCLERISDEEMATLDLSSWSLALNGAEPIAPTTLRAFQERFAPVGLRPEALMPVYGLSEMALAVTFSAADEPFTSKHFLTDSVMAGQPSPSPAGSDLTTELVSVGRPLPDYGIEIRGTDGQTLPSSQVGHIWVRGPSMMAGYLGRDEQPMHDGWLDTGDLGFIHDDELYITGRAKDLIILRGRNHAPQDIERAVDGIDGVRTGCAVAVADVGSHGERLLVFLEVRNQAPGQAQACERAILSATGLKPDLIALLEPGTLPRTSSGKLRRSESLRRWRSGTLTPPKSVTPWMLAGTMAESFLAQAQARWRSGRNT